MLETFFPLNNTLKKRMNEEKGGKLKSSGISVLIATISRGNVCVCRKRLFPGILTAELDF